MTLVMVEIMDVVIPSAINRKIVTEICAGAFEFSNDNIEWTSEQ